MDEDEYLMLSGLQHFAFCRRQWALIHVEQQWAENYQTAAGELMHERAHDEALIEKRQNKIITRGLRISSSTLGLTGQCDVVEFHRDADGITLWEYDGKWKIIPIEYKHGEPKQGQEDEIQLCAQAMCLEEMFLTTVTEGDLYYGENRHRTKVIFTDQLRKATIQCAQEMHELFRRGYTPKVRREKKCRSCSLKDICMPALQSKCDVGAYIQHYIQGQDED
ncbi:MAG: CRISPR-associated protein Cas4 [Clostridium sp.]